MNFFSEETFVNNAYLAVPRNKYNSKYTAFLNYTAAGATVSNITTILKSDIDTGMFCYYCWYVVGIMSNSTGASTYRVYISENGDAGSDITAISIGNPASITLPGIGTVDQRKFLVNSKDAISVEFTISTGSIIAYIGLYPESPLTKSAWKVEGSTGTVKLRIRTTDP